MTTEYNNWDDYVRAQVDELLNIFTPLSSEGGVSIKYTHPIKEEYEDHIEYEEDKANGVQVVLEFIFEDEVDLNEEK